MLSDLTQWLSTLYPEQLLTVFIGMLLVDTPRYALSKALMCLWDWICSMAKWFLNTPVAKRCSYCPAVCVIISCWNEADTISATLNSVWGTYPKLQIIVVDDGSDDNTAALMNDFAMTHPGILALRRPVRGGKSSAINFALRYTDAEVIMTVDADSHLGPDAIWRIVQPLQDPRVGGVSASVVARNPFVNLVTWLQAFEYLNSILVGRILAARLGMLAICSGALAAFSRPAIERGVGWDNGPGEDADITIRIRKSGYKIAFVPEAECFTNVPTKWKGLFKQRLRWDRSLVRYNMRKHIDIAYFWNSNFRLTNFLHLIDIFYFNVVCTYGFWIYTIIYLLDPPTAIWPIILTIYLSYVVFGTIPILTVLYYSNDRLRDALICLIVPFVPFYQLFLRLVRTIAVTDELLFRRSYQDNYVPERVRNATWHW